MAWLPVLNKQTFSKFSKGCAIWKNKQNDHQYHSWLTEHVCKINHHSSYGAMESAGAIEMVNHQIHMKSMALYPRNWNAWVMSRSA